MSRTKLHATIFLILLGCFASSALPAASQCDEDCGEVILGRPKLWALEDAQYLIGQTLERLKGLEVTLPENGSIDPNRVNSSELEVVTRALGIGANFDAATALKNRRSLEDYDRKRARADEARQELAILRPRIQKLELEKARLEGEEEALQDGLDAINERLGEIEPLLAELDTGDQDAAKPALSSAKRSRLLDERTSLRVERLSVKTEQADNLGARTRVDQELAVLQTRETALATDAADVAFPTEVQSTAATGGDIRGDNSALQQLLNSNKVEDALAARLNQILTNDANLHYVHELDNLLDAELQLISRRLTLLRQSVDPNYDLYFMELTSSLTPFRKAKNHIARARWTLETGEPDFSELRPQRSKGETADALANAACDFIRWNPSRYTDYPDWAGPCDVYAGSSANIVNRLRAEGVLDEVVTKAPPVDWHAATEQYALDNAPEKIAIAYGCESIAAEEMRSGDAKQKAEIEACDRWMQSGDISGDLGRALTTGQSTGWHGVPESVRQQDIDTRGVENAVMEAQADAGCAQLARATGRAADACAAHQAGESALRVRFEQLGLLEQVEAAHAAVSRTANAREAAAAFDAVFREREPYIFEMTPTQSAMNVSRHQKISKNFVFEGAFRFLFGFGAKTNYQRQREQFRQFLEQRVFIAGHGKGSNVFGWDYAPLPGDRYVAQGSYTSYAVLAVPKNVRTLKMTACADWRLKPDQAPRRESYEIGEVCQGQGHGASTLTTGGEGKRKLTETIVLPNESDFWVHTIHYETVPEGEDTSVILHGRGFTRETSILVNNVPLDPRWRLIDGGSSDASFLAPKDGVASKVSVNTALGGDRKVVGEFEVVSSTRIVMRFNCGAGFVGVPQITLVAPKKSVHLNRLDLQTAGFNGAKVRLDRIHSDFLAGKSLDRVFFKPKEGWPGVRKLEIREMDDAKQMTGFVLDVAGIDLSDAKKIKVFDANRTGQNAWGLRELPATEALPIPAQHRIRFRGIKPKDGRISILVFRYQGPETTRSRIDADVSNWQASFEHSFLPPFGPVVTGGPAPSNGPAAGTNKVTINGHGLSTVDKVYFDNTAVTEIVDRSDSHLVVRAPKGTASTSVKIRLVSKTVRNGKRLEARVGKEYKYDPAPKKTAKAGG